MQHKSIYFPIRQSGYVGKCMNYFNSLNCPETSLRASERGGRGRAVLSVCSRDRNHSCSFNCPKMWEMGVPTRCSDGGKAAVPQQGELRAKSEPSSCRAVSLGWSFSMPCRTASSLVGTLPADPH